MSANTFERHEVKYIVTSAQRGFIERALESLVTADCHGESTICNIYYDTPDFRLVRRSLERPIYKEKLRMRSYGVKRPDEEVFLELKKKYKGLVYKRRIEGREQAFTDYLAGKAEMPVDSQIGREIDYFREFYGELRPAVYLCYDRTAFFAKDDPTLRITFDKSIRFRTCDISLSSAPGGRAILEPGLSLMEIKAADAMPLWLVEALGRAEAKKTSFSKYGRAYEAIMQEKINGNEVRVCA